MTTIQDRIIQRFIDRGFVKEGDWLNNPKAKQVVSCYAKPVIEFLVESIKEVQEETRKEEHEICKKIHLIELDRWSIYEPNADEFFEEEYQSLTNKEVKK